MVDQNAGTNNTLLNEVLVHCSILKKISRLRPLVWTSFCFFITWVG